MSRGLGKLQRLIISTLESRTGGDRIGKYDSLPYSLEAQWHDLRKVKVEVAKVYGVETWRGIYPGDLYHDIKWDATFSRALRSLEKRKLIIIARYRDRVPLRGMPAGLDQDMPIFSPYRRFAKLLTVG